MHDDDEKRFPRITLWQFAKGAILTPIAFLEWVFGYGLIADSASWRKERKKQPDAGASERTVPQAPDGID